MSFADISDNVVALSEKMYNDRTLVDSEGYEREIYPDIIGAIFNHK